MQQADGDVFLQRIVVLAVLPSLYSRKEKGNYGMKKEKGSCTYQGHNLALSWQCGLSWRFWIKQNLRI